MVQKRVSRDRVAAGIGAAVVAVAAIALLGHLGSTVHGLSSKGSLNDSYDALGRTIAASDTLDIDNGWAVAAVQTVRPRSTYAVVLPPPTAVSDGQMSVVTYDAVAPYMRYLLLPAVPAPPGNAKYVLCYACGRSFSGVRWVWVGETGSKLPGLKIGVRGGG